MQREDITEKVKAIMDQACPGVFEKHQDKLADIFSQATYYDMYLKVIVKEQTAEIFTHERGKKIYSFVTDNEDIVKYALLHELVGVENASRSIYDNTYLDSVFAKIDYPYSAWHKQGIGMFQLDKISEEMRNT